MSEKFEGNVPSEEYEQDDKPIDVEKDPFAYNKEFDPSNPDHFKAWLLMRPTHIPKEEWPIKLAELKLLLESESVKNEHDKSMVILGWKSKNDLLPKQK